MRLAASEQETTTTINAKLAKSNVKKVRIIVSTLVYSTGQLILGVALLVYVWKKDAEKLSRSYKENLELPLFDLATIVNVTCNFSNDNKLGEGDSRSVFKIDQKACYWIGLSALTLLMALLGSFSIFIKILD